MPDYDRYDAEQLRRACYGPDPDLPQDAAWLPVMPEPLWDEVVLRRIAVGAFTAACDWAEAPTLNGAAEVRDWLAEALAWYVGERRRRYRDETAEESDEGQEAALRSYLRGE